MIDPVTPEPTTDDRDNGWAQTYRDCGYTYCRPCGEWHRPPECAIDEHGRALDWDGAPWELGGSNETGTTRSNP